MVICQNSVPAATPCIVTTTATAKRPSKHVDERTIQWSSSFRPKITCYILLVGRELNNIHRKIGHCMLLARHVAVRIMSTGVRNPFRLFPTRVQHFLNIQRIISFVDWLILSTLAIDAACITMLYIQPTISQVSQLLMIVARPSIRADCILLIVAATTIAASMSCRHWANPGRSSSIPVIRVWLKRWEVFVAIRHDLGSGYSVHLR